MPLSVPSQRTWAVNDIVTAAMMNANVRDAVNYLLNPPIFVGTQAVAQSFTSGANTALIIDTNVVDTYTGHSTITNNTRYVAQVAGWYAVTGSIQWATGTGYRIIYIAKNGTTELNQSDVRVPATTNTTGVVTTTYVQLNVNDYVEAYGIQSTGGALSTVAGYPSLQAIWIHA